MNKIKVTSGIGQYHTNEPDQTQPKKKLTPYLAIDWLEIQDRVDHPESVEKTQGHWLIPSTLPRRNAKAQEADGLFHLLWADLDKAPPSIPELAVILEGFIGEADYEIYNTRSATEANQKARILIPVTDPLSSYEFKLLQQVLNDKFSAVGIEPDPANLGCSQVCYLPNAGAIYSSASRRDGKQLDPVIKWAKELCYLCDKQDEQQAVLLEATQRAVERRSALTLSNTVDPVKRLIGTFDQGYTPHELMLNCIYDQDGDSFRHPNSESGNYTATVRRDDQGVWRVNTLSTSDPLYTAGAGAHDAFSVFTVLYHGGDKKAAMIDAGDNWLTIGGVSFNKALQREHEQKKAAQQPKVEFDIDDLLASQESRNETVSKTKDDPEIPLQIPVSTFNQTLDTEHRYCSVDLLRKVDDNHTLKRLCIQVAAETHLPVNTVFLMGLTVFSSIASRKYAVEYQNGEHIPIGLYSVVEQPSGTGKSWCWGTFQKPFIAIQQELLRAVLKKMKDFEKKTGSGEELTENEQTELKELGQKRERLSTGLFVTNSTPEALEMTLNGTNGFFSAVSSEQGLFNSLLGNSYKSEKNANNNDVMLNGFDGGHVNSIRVSRKGYNGRVIGGVACFAQQGSIEVVLKSSNGTGLSERFLMLAEPHSLGKRDHTKRIQTDPLLSVSYANHCDLMKSVINDPITLDELNNLSISDDGFLKINQYRNKIEPDLVDGGKFSHVSLRGAASKINMQIMKIASNLHLLDYDMQPEIPERHVIAAIDIANELLEANLKLCRDKGIMGVKAEFTAVINYLTGKFGVKSERDILNNIRGVQPFKDFTGNRTQLIKDTLKEMTEQKLLNQSWDTVGKSAYTLAQ